MMMAMIMLVLIGMIGALLSTMSIYDVRQSRRNYDYKKVSYLSEAAMTWAISMVKDGSSFPCTTHDSTGTLTDTTGGAGCNGKVDFLASTSAWYPGTSPTRDTAGWIQNSPLEIENSFSGDTSEILAFKVWFPTPTTVRIQSKGMIGKIESSLHLFGNR